MPGPRPARPRRSVLFDLLICLLVTGLTLLGLLTDDVPRATMVPGFVMAVALYLRRRHPVPVLGVVAIAALGQVVAFAPAFDPLPYDLAVLIAMYSVVKYARRMREAYLAAGVVAAGIVIELVRHPGAGQFWLGIWYVSVCTGVWLGAYTLRNRRLYVTGLEERAATLEREREHLARIAVADERAAIARELHDIVAHSLAVMIVQADGGRYAMDAEPDKARQALETVAATGREALADMGRLVDVLRGSGDGAVEPERTPVSVAHLDDLVERARTAGLAVTLDRTGELADLPPSVGLTVFRLMQEGLTNVLRHARPGARVTVDLARRGDTVNMSIVDDGGGPAVNGSRRERVGHGLIGMRERVTVHSGEFTAGRELSGGWAVRASIPLGGKVTEEAVR